MMATKYSILTAMVLISAGSACAIYHDEAARQAYMMKTLYPHDSAYYAGLNPSASSGATQPAGVPLPYSGLNPSAPSGATQLAGVPSSYASNPGTVNIRPGTSYTASTYSQSANIVQPSPATVTVEYENSPPASPNAAQAYASTQNSAAASVPAPDPASVTVNAADPSQQEAAVKSELTTVTFTNGPAGNPPAGAYSLPPASYNVAPTADQASAATRLLPLYTQVSSDPSKSLTINRPSDIPPQYPSAYAQQLGGNPNRPLNIDSVQQTTVYSQQIPGPVSLNQPSSFLPQQSAPFVQPQVQSYLPSQGHVISSYTRPVETSIPPSPTIPQYQPPAQTIPPYGSASQNVYVHTSPGFAETFGSTLNQRPAVELYVSPSGAVYLADQNGNLIPTQQYAPGYTSSISVYAAPQPSHVGSMHPLTANDLKSNLKISPSAVPAPIDGSASYNFKANDMMGLYKPITYLGPVSNPLRYIATFNNQQPIRLSISTGRTAEGQDQKNINGVPQTIGQQTDNNPEQKAQLASISQQTVNNQQQKAHDEEIRKIEQQITEKEQEASVMNAKINSLSAKTGTVSNPQQRSDSELLSGGKPLYANANPMSRDDRKRAPGEPDPVVGNPQAIIRGLQELSKMGLGDLLVFSPPGYAESLARQDGRATAP